LKDAPGGIVHHLLRCPACAGIFADGLLRKYREDIVIRSGGTQCPDMTRGGDTQPVSKSKGWDSSNRCDCGHGHRPQPWIQIFHHRSIFRIQRKEPHSSPGLLKLMKGKIQSRVLDAECPFSGWIFGQKTGYLPS
jgi:hypothetical protein